MYAFYILGKEKVGRGIWLGRGQARVHGKFVKRRGLTTVESTGIWRRR